MNNVRVLDMVGAGSADPSLALTGENFSTIDDVTDLPATFTNVFGSITPAAGGSANGVSKDVGYVLRMSAQVVCPAVGAGFSSGVVKLQRSNIGGTDEDSWKDITNATVNVTGTGTYFIDLPEGGIRTGKFLRAVASAVGGTMTVHVVGFGHTK